MSALVLTPVASSQIAAIGHDADASQLTVLFKGKGDAPGSAYVYDSVTADDYAALAGAESVGAHFAATIKRDPAAHPFRKVDAASFVIGGPAVAA